MIAWPEPQLRQHPIQALARGKRERLYTGGKRAENLVEKLIRPCCLSYLGEYVIEHCRRQRILIRHHGPPSAGRGPPRYARPHSGQLSSQPDRHNNHQAARSGHPLPRYQGVHAPPTVNAQIDRL